MTTSGSPLVAPTGLFREAWADVDLEAVRHNVAALARLAAPALFCAVVKADAYGHGAVPVAEAAVDAGASWLAVALVEEGVALRDAGLDVPVLVLSEPPPAAMEEVLRCRLTPTLYTLEGVEALARAAAARPSVDAVSVHVKVDTGMHRVGATATDAVVVAREVAASRALGLEGVWTHLAVADDPESCFTAEQCERFDEARRHMAEAGVQPRLAHVANSAGLIAHPRARYDLVRCGIAIYGYPPSAALAGTVDLRPALSLRARVALVKEVDAGEGISYGLRYHLERKSVIATVPLGYADGVPRRLSSVGGEVLIGGRRRPIAGTVTMDHIMVDCGEGESVAPGDEVVLLGQQGGDRITADDWAAALDTISYEVVSRIGPRVPRVYR